ncbi:SLIT-ROBO Rho GTPase-activating protein 1 isoform X8 [Mirounga angustirostris]|uniref:SLIT-ROBO Rho GTPase-activating protein 1 isoform X8 n=1 Tax=Mirounga angustirostris TaxID=9716 RepID=UPI00313B1F23
MSTPSRFKKDKEIVAEYESQVKEIRAQLVEQQKCLEQQTEMRVQLLQDLQDFFRKKAEIETEYSRNLEKLAERFMAKTRSTKDHQQYKKDQNLLSPVNCWYLLLNQVRRESKDHATLSDIYLNNVIMRFMQISEDSTRMFKKSKEIAFQLHEDLMKVLNELYTVMKTYHMYHAESISAESKLKEAEKQEEKQIGRSGDPVFHIRLEERHQRRSSVKKIEKMKEKRQAKYSENKLKSIKARNEYLLTLEATNASVFKYYIHDLSDLIDCCDLGYHASLNRALRTYLSAEYNLETSRHEGLDIIENAVDNLEPRSDKQRFMEMYPAAFCPPMKFEFQSHMGDEVCQVSAQQPVQAELMLRYQQLQSRLATLKIENEEVKKTTEATLQTIQDMVTIEDYDVSECFQHSRSTESVKSTVSETYLSKPSIAKRRANQQETEQFYFMKLREYLEGSNLITKLQAKHDLLQRTLGEGHRAEYMTTRPPNVPPKPQKHRKSRPRSQYNAKLFNGDLETFVKDSGQIIPLIVESCIRFINLYGLQHQGIFRVSGSQVEVNDIKNSFERGENPLADDQSNHDINSVAGVLKLYFRGLENPLFPKERFNDLISCIRIDNLYERALHIRKLLLTLPRSVLIVMRYLFAFLNHLSQYSDENMMDPYNLAICFGPTLMPVPEIQDQVSCQAHVNEIVKTIIIHHETIFPDAKELDGPVYEKCMAGDDYWAIIIFHWNSTNFNFCGYKSSVSKMKGPALPSDQMTLGASSISLKDYPETLLPFQSHI